MADTCKPIRKAARGIVSYVLAPSLPALQTVSITTFYLSYSLYPYLCYFYFLVVCVCMVCVCVCVTPTIGLHLIFGSWDLSPVLTVCLDWLTIMPQYTCPHKHGHEHTHAHAHTHHSPPSTRIKCRTVPQP